MPRNPAWRPLRAAVAVGAVAGAVAFAAVEDGEPGTVVRGTSAPSPSGTVPATAAAAPATATPSPEAAAAPPPAPPALPLRASLRRAVDRAASASGGRVQIAVTHESGRRVVAAASSGSTRTPFRMWSVSKVATAIALLQEHGWDRKARPPLRADVTRALESALVRSGDCAQRQMVVELQERLGGPEPARRAVERVLRAGDARGARVYARAAAAGSGCQPFLARTRTPDPYRVALQLGTAEWMLADAARFALALGNGNYPPAVTRRILSLLRRDKLHSDDPFARGLDVTSRLDWGAGEALGDLRPAYKSGWGGSSGETATFVTEQVIHLRTAAGRYGIAVTFEPPARPSRDDPGLTRAPQAIAAALRAVRRRLGR